MAKEKTEDAVDQETTDALKAQDEAEAATAKEHLYTGPTLTPEEYDAVGKGDGYKPHNTDNTFAGAHTAVAGTPEAAAQQGNIRPSAPAAETPSKA